MLKKISLLLAISLFVAATGVFAQSTATANPTATPTTAKAKKPSFRATKDQIIAVQTKLKDAKLYTGEATGKRDAALKTAIKSFQKDNGLKANGSLNRATLEKMGIELTEPQKLIPVSPSSFASTKPAKPKTETKTATSTNKTTETAASSNMPKKPGPFRANVDQIKAAQKILRDGKMLNGGEEGKLDDPTRAALKKYQEANGLKVSDTGALNAATLEKMGIALTDAQKANVAAQAAYDAAKAKTN